MKKNDTAELGITAMTAEGNGVARHEGMVVFVPFTAAGDRIRCRIVKVCRSYAYGKAEEIIIPSPDRIDSDCPVFGKCGGCVFRHISYDVELRVKEAAVRDAFQRIGSTLGRSAAPEFLPICASEMTDGYRNKLQMPFARAADGTDSAGLSGVVCGFFAGRSHRVIPVGKCLLQPDIFSEITAYVSELAGKLRISVYNEEKHEGVLRHIYLRKGHYSGEICLCLVVRKNAPELRTLAKRVMEKFPQIKGAVLNINPGRTNVILGEREIPLFGTPVINDVMCGVSVEISPKSFYQVNTSAAERLYGQAAEFATPEGKTILDLYCGAGTIGLSMAGKAGRIIGAEIIPEAVENARRSAARCGITNAEFIRADAGEAAKQLAERKLRPDVIILDPPRKGCGAEVLSACADMSPERIVMVSCNPSTAARDCAALRELGYVTVAVRPFDLFPRTAHVECVVLMTKEK